MSYLIFLALYTLAVIVGYQWGIHIERRRRLRVRVALLLIAQKYHTAKSAIINN